LLAVDDGSGGIVTGARLDLPTADQPLGPVHAALDLVIAKLTTREGISVVLAGYGPADRVEPMVTAAAEALLAAGIPISDALRVADGRFWRLRCADPAACPPHGVPFEPATSPAAAAAVYAGLVALPDREALAATLAPVTGRARDGMVAATVAACVFLDELLDAARADAEAGDRPDSVLDTKVGRALQAAARIYLTQIQDSYRAGQPVDDEHAATLTVLLELASLREFSPPGAPAARRGRSPCGATWSAGPNLRSPPRRPPCWPCVPCRPATVHWPAWRLIGRWAPTHGTASRRCSNGRSPLASIRAPSPRC